MTGTEVDQKWKSWGIPISEFIEDVGKYLNDNFKVEGKEVGTDNAEVALRKLDEMLHKYKMFEAGLAEKVRKFWLFFMASKQWFIPRHKWAPSLA